MRESLSISNIQEFFKGDLNSSSLEGKGKIQGHTMFEKIKKNMSNLGDKNFTR